MRIGSFVKKNHTTIDTIRHYIELGLLLPEKSGAVYDFDERCQDDLEEIFSFKEMGFSLQDIKFILYFKRLAKLTSYQEDDYFSQLFHNKQNELSKKIKQLHLQQEKLEQLLVSIEEKKATQASFPKLGVSLQILPILRCACCQGELSLSEGTLKNNQIIDGILCCSCGKQYVISEGILMDDSTKSYDFDFDVPHYIKETPNRYLDNLTQGMEWLHKKLNLSTEFKQKVILELGSGFGFFLRSIFEDLPSDCIYIAVDYDRTRQLFLKQCLETIPSHKNILFLCADFLKIPIKQGSIDVLCDISGTSNYSFEHTSFLPECMSPYLKSENLLVGSYLLFQKFTTNSMIPKEFQRYFIEADLQKKLHAIDYDILLETHSPIANKGGKYENYFNDGDQVYSYGLIAKRRG